MLDQESGLPSNENGDFCLKALVRNVRVRGTITNPRDSTLKVELDFIAETGAMYAVITKRIDNELKLKETGRRKL